MRKPKERIIKSTLPRKKMPCIDMTMTRARSVLPVRYQNLEPANTFPCEEGLFLFGPSGTGKTHKAVQFFLKWIQKSGDFKKCHFYEVPELLELLRREYDKSHSYRPADSIQHVSTLCLCKTARLLVLDDLGSEKLTEWAVERLGLIISCRYNGLLPTIITSNLTIDEISQTISQRIGSRLSQLMGIQIKGVDRRCNSADA